MLHKAERMTQQRYRDWKKQSSRSLRFSDPVQGETGKRWDGRGRPSPEVRDLTHAVLMSLEVIAPVDSREPRITFFE